MPDIGELVVGAWLTEVKGYDFVVYNQRPGRDLPEEFAPKGLAGVAARLGELDVIGLHTPNRVSYLAECTTHLGGLIHGGGKADALQKLKNKFAVSAAYAAVLQERTELEPTLAFWSPKVPKALIDRHAELEEATGRPVEMVVNDTYTARVNELIDAASRRMTVTGNDFYRTLQLLSHLSRSPFIELPKPTLKKVAQATAQLSAAGPIIPWAEVIKVHKTQAGIRAPRGRTEASIICNTGAHGPYPDRFLGPDVLHYVGRGLEGDQALDRDNESLRQGIESGVPVRVFEKLTKNQYLDHGTWFGVGEPLWHLDPVSGRRLVVFTMRRA